MLFTIGNPKTAKGEARGYLTAVLHLAPHEAAGVGNMCPRATPGCIATCLNTAGRGGIFKAGATTNAVQEARKRRTREYVANREAVLSSKWTASPHKSAVKQGILRLAIKLL